MSTTNQHVPSSNNSYRQKIVNKTLGEVRTFLDEVSNGTSNYRSLHSLTEQIEHQYSGRYLIELIQNAHDALLVSPPQGSKQRIEIAVIQDSSPFGALYVANDGSPFTSSNFKSISKLGQSDKNPEDSIGNKGIGFRSVLEIGDSPEIFSRSRQDSALFDGFCFQFFPEGKQEFSEPIRRLEKGEASPPSPLDENIPLVQWGKEKIRSLQQNIGKYEPGWLQQELQLLSPYLLPFPISSKDNGRQHIREYERRGFATVIRLPFLSDDVREAVMAKVEEMKPVSVLFLERVQHFSLVINAKVRIIQRQVAPIQHDPEKGRKVVLRQNDTSGTKEPQEYWLWEKLIGGDQDQDGSERLRKSVQELPGKWPQLTKVNVAFALKISTAPEPGFINIYLPTMLPSGCGAHFSGPFYGDMSRTSIDFKKSYNNLLLRTLAEKATAVMFNSLAGKDTKEAAVIIDLLSTVGAAFRERWWAQLSQVWDQQHLDITDEKICLTDEGWCVPEMASLLRVSDKPKTLTPQLLRQSACYLAFSESLATRSELIKDIYDRINIDPYALDEQQANTLEKAADILHQVDTEVDWNSFWHDIDDILEGDASLLKGKKVLLGTDGNLHAVGNKSAVFFRPLKFGTDDEVESEEAIDEIPEKLRPFIAFLHESIHTHKPGERGGHETTRVHGILSSSLVKRFGIEQILRSVLIPAIPSLPVPLQSQDGELCCDILQWGLKLILSLVARDKGENVSRLLARLPAPCHGGWYQLDQTAFGSGWDDPANGSLGENLELYLSKVNTPECREAYKKLLLPPDNSYWGALTRSGHDLLDSVGVFRGLRPIKITSDSWGAQFLFSKFSTVELPETAPPAFEKSCWKRYRTFAASEIEPRFSGRYEYGFKPFFTLPGLDRYEEFDNELREIFMGILLASISFWGIAKSWKVVVIHKTSGESHNIPVKSPLKFFLEETEWLVDSQKGSKDFFRPRERWYVPIAVLAGRKHHYDHLKPVPSSITAIMEKRPSLTVAMQDLGMPQFDLEKQTSDTRLLDDLAIALSDPVIEIANMDVFLGMVRNAWKQFYPEEGGILPEILVVSKGTRILEVMEPTVDIPIFLPDATEALHEGLELHSKQLVAVETRDAKRLRSFFMEFYGDTVQLASSLIMRPSVNGEPWVGEATQLLSQDNLDWLPPVILSVFAYAAQQSHGTATKAFQQAMETLRGARVKWVDTLEIGLWREESLVANMPIEAFWYARESTLLAEIQGRQELNVLSEALSAMVDRADLSISLKLVLWKILGRDELNQEDICDALKEVGVTPDRFAEVQQRWLGNLSWTIKNLHPIILLLCPEADTSSLDQCNSDAQIESYLKNLGLEFIKGEKIFEIARTSQGFQQTGKYLFKILGERAQLEQWNVALSSLGQRLLITVPEIKDQFQRHLETARKPFRAIIRRALKSNPTKGRFVEIEDQLHELKCPRDWSKRFWEVRFQMVMEEAAVALIEVGAIDHEIDVVIQAEYVGDLREGLTRLGLEPEIDPLEIHGKNFEKVKNLLETLQKTAIVWCEKNSIAPELWGEGVAEIMAHLEGYMATHAFLDDWDEALCFETIRQLPKTEGQAMFWDAVSTAQDMLEIMKALDISEQELAQADESLQRQQQQAEKRKRMVEVCGRPFDNSSENLTNLWEHLEHNLGTDAISGFDVGKWLDLQEQKTKKGKGPGKKGKNGNRKRGRPAKRMSPAMKNLVGMAGEIYVYKLLQKAFGSDIVGPDCWLSEYSRLKFPENRTDDGYGCDFEVTTEDKTYCFEVKATTGEDEEFKLGSSEIRLGVELANKRKKIFSIIHVMNALTDSPDVRLLPNPYTNKYKSFYQIQEAGLRIRYEAKT